MVIRIILYILVFLLGAISVVLGFRGMQNKRILNGTVFVVLGLALVMFSGLKIYDEISMAITDEKIVEISTELKVVQDRFRKISKVREDFVKQLEEEYVALGKLGIEAESIPQLIHNDTNVRMHVERISLLNRWIAICDEQLATDTIAIKSYENMIFYHKNLQVVDSLSIDGSSAFRAEMDLEKVIEDAKVQFDESEPLDITTVEIQQVVDAMRSR